MEMVNMTCEVTAVGFVYVILPAILNHTLRRDCEQSWYSEDRSLIAHPSSPLRLIDPATAVKSDRLFTSRCVNLYYEIRCDSADGFHYRHEIVFRVRNETEVSGLTQTPGSHQLLWLFAPLIIVLFTIILICFMLRKRQSGCFQRDARIVCQHEGDSEDRDPESAVVMI